MDYITLKLNEQHTKHLHTFRKYGKRRASAFGRVIGDEVLPETIQAKVIHPLLATFQMETDYSSYVGDWYVIHIPTGWVLAVGNRSVISNVRNTFPKMNWEYTELNTKEGIFGHFRLIDTFDWTIICKLRYEVIKEDTYGPQT